MNQLNLFLKSVIFNIFGVGTVTVGVSWVLSRLYDQSLDLGIVALIGIVFLFLGLLIYVSTVFSFLQNRGTPMIFFMKK